MSKPADELVRASAMVDKISAIIEEDRDWKVVAIALGFVVNACEELSEGNEFRRRFEFNLASARSVELPSPSQMS